MSRISTSRSLTGTPTHRAASEDYDMQWETVIGLEIHAQLSTRSKIFSGSATTFGAEPNTQASLVDLGMPGTLPVLNAEAVRMACQFGLAIDAEIGERNVFARKNYFYPDLPKGYQTSQMDHPIVGKGFLDITLEDGTVRRIGITRAHLEEDAGKSLHEDFSGMSGIDLNRAGTPLLEIVSEPDIRVKAIHALVRYLGICDGNMAEGSLRCDCNVSVRPKGQAEFGTRAEIKNVNSFRFIEKAINHEVQRQIELIEDGGKVVQETRLYDPNKDETRSMRSKEEANDYRYFPCPDLLPVVIERDFLAQLRSELPELPPQKRERFQSQYGLSAYDADVLSASREMAEYFEQVTEGCGDAKLAANWVMGELSSLLNKDNLEIDQSPVSAAQLAGMILRIRDNTISGKLAKMVFEALAAGEGATADEVIEKKGLKQVTDSGAIEKMLDEVLAANAEQVEQYRASDEAKRGKMFGFFVGQAMKASKGKANPGQVNELLKKKLEQ
jgi:aspartyl-tRNA(Asn)/glutamyl-tRNA(Gln) amidotransferase subunit B